MKLRILSVFIVVLFSSCKETSDKEKYRKLAPAIIDTTRISIVRYDSSKRDCKRAFLDGRTSFLNNDDLKKIEFTIDQIISRRNPIQANLFDEYSRTYPKENYKLENFLIKKDRYVRRYLVILNAKGEKEIFVAMICDEMASDPYIKWRGNVDQGHGGGTCFFSFKLNFKTNKYYDVYFNAEA